VEQSLKEKEARSLRTERVEWKESGVLSDNRQYLRVSLSRFAFDICAAPFGKDFFFSWWLMERQPDATLLVGCGAAIVFLAFLATLIRLGGALAGSLIFLIVLA